MLQAVQTLSVIALLIAGAHAMPTENRHRHPALKMAPAAHVTKATADAINARNGGTWTASEKQGSLISGATLEELKRLMGVKKMGKKNVLPRKTFRAEEARAVPASFDAAAQWPECPTITHIRDQSACGSCWAVAAAEAISDRYCTFGGPKNLPISAANLMECCSHCGDGCNGGDPYYAWFYWTTPGLLSDACQPYPFPKCEHHIPAGKYPECPSTTYNTPPCSSSCNASSVVPTLYTGQSAYGLVDEPAFQQELMANGPFEVTFSVYADFPLYKSGVYVQNSTEYLGGHAVKLVGWGTLNGVPYWKIANSWNDGWGMDGYFLIKRGVDECGIEGSGTAGIPDLSGLLSRV
jgi:cysteine peptidase C